MQFSVTVAISVFEFLFSLCVTKPKYIQSTIHKTVQNISLQLFYNKNTIEEFALEKVKKSSFCQRFLTKTIRGAFLKHTTLYF